MTLPLLVPRPGWPVSRAVPAPRAMPTQHDWAALYPEIERLYVHERRKLRYIMQFMESEHGFKATEQMYKRRFATWGFRKNCQRSAAAVPAWTTTSERKRVANRKPSHSGEMGSVPALTRLNLHDGLLLMFLTSVRVYSVAFFQSMQSRDGSLASFQRPLPEHPARIAKNKEISVTFKLVVDLLGRGHGDLAGRMARKAFLLSEGLLTLDGPVLVWNLLEIMHHMVILHHAQLFQMLLVHLIALVDGRMPNNHPLSTMLRSLRGLVGSLRSGRASPNDYLLSPPTSFPQLPSIRNDKITTNSWLRYTSHALSPLLERAWILNAEILFDNFDPRLFHLYSSIHWDSCSVSLPAAMLGAVDQWINQIRTQQDNSATSEARRAAELSESTPVEEQRMLQRLLTPRMDASPPRDFEMLRASSIATLRERGGSVLSKRAGFIGSTNTMLRILVGVVKAEVFEARPAAVEDSECAGIVKVKVPRVHADHLACTMMTLMDLNLEQGGDTVGPPLDTVESIRTVVSLREYARSEIDPQVVREMWLLQDALNTADRHVEGGEVAKSASRRVERYIQDIPIESV